MSDSETGVCLLALTVWLMGFGLVQNIVVQKEIHDCLLLGSQFRGGLMQPRASHVTLQVIKRSISEEANSYQRGSVHSRTTQARPLLWGNPHCIGSSELATSRVGIPQAHTA